MISKVITISGVERRGQCLRRFVTLCIYPVMMTNLSGGAEPYLTRFLRQQRYGRVEDQAAIVILFTIAAHRRRAQEGLAATGYL